MSWPSNVVSAKQVQSSGRCHSWGHGRRVHKKKTGTNRYSQGVTYMYTHVSLWALSIYGGPEEWRELNDAWVRECGKYVPHHIQELLGLLWLQGPLWTLFTGNMILRTVHVWNISYSVHLFKKHVVIGWLARATATLSGWLDCRNFLSEANAFISKETIGFSLCQKRVCQLTIELGMIACWGSIFWRGLNRNVAKGSCHYLG